MANPDTETTQTPAASAPEAQAPAPAAPETPAAEAPVASEPQATTVTVDTTPVAAQVIGERPAQLTTVPVHEVRVDSDHAILDTSSPLAVQVPVPTGQEGLTPIAIAYADGKTASEKIADQESAAANA